MDSYWPESTLADLLDIHVQNYEQDFREYWHLDAESAPSEMSAEDWGMARLLDQVGSKMVDSARLLRLHPELAAHLRTTRPWESPHAAAADLNQYAIAQSRAEIDLASQAVGRLFEGKKRLSMLVLMLSEFTLSDRAAAFVDRMVQSFIWGLDTETTVMARAAIEAAFEECVSDVQMAAIGMRRNKHGFAYWQYRDAVEQLGLVDAERLDDVDTVRRSGNEAVHAAPGLHPNSLTTVVRTILVLRALFPSPTI